MKIVADENIPLVYELFGHLGEVNLLPGRNIQPADVENADILLVRSITAVNESLLKNSRVQFVGSATAGMDHIDTEWLTKAGISFASAKGSNSEAVAEYVVACIAALHKQGLLSGNRAGVIGVGNAGDKVVKVLKILGFNVLQNDPPRELREKNFSSVHLTHFSSCDFISVHTPLINAGPYPTQYLLNKNFIQSLKSKTVLLNAGRGTVLNTRDFNQFGQHLIGCFDVWEDEPDIDPELLAQAIIATPHIAGYTLQAKMRGTFMLYQAAQKLWQFPSTITEKKYSLLQELSLSSTMTSWEDVVLKVYDPMIDTQRLKSSPEKFDEFRKHYPQRHEFASIVLQNTQHIKDADKNILKKLGFRLS